MHREVYTRHSPTLYPVVTFVSLSNRSGSEGASTRTCKKGSTSIFRLARRWGLPGSQGGGGGLPGEGGGGGGCEDMRAYGRILTVCLSSSSFLSCSSCTLAALSSAFLCCKSFTVRRTSRCLTLEGRERRRGRK